MAIERFNEIESEFARLSPQAQLNLLERLVHRVRVSAGDRQENWDAELSAMAADPEVQRELNHVLGKPPRFCDRALGP